MKKRKAIRGIQYIVKGCHWEQRIVVEGDFGTDNERMMEACTRAVELESNKNKKFDLGALMEVYHLEDENKVNKHCWVSSYIILVNAGLYKFADILKKALKKMGVNIDSLKNSGPNEYLSNENKESDDPPF